MFEPNLYFDLYLRFILEFLKNIKCGRGGKRPNGHASLILTATRLHFLYFDFLL